MAEFGTPETWNMKVGDFIETQLPQEKPQALLDLQEQNRKQRLLDALQKIGPGLMDESLDFIRRQNFFIGGLPTVIKALSKTQLESLLKPEAMTKETFNTAKLRQKLERAAKYYVDKFHGGSYAKANNELGYTPTDGKNNAFIQKLKRTFGFELKQNIKKLTKFTEEEKALPLPKEIENYNKQELKRYIQKENKNKNFNNINLYKAIDKYTTEHAANNLVKSLNELKLVKSTIEKTHAMARGYKLKSLPKLTGKDGEGIIQSKLDYSQKPQFKTMGELTTAIKSGKFDLDQHINKLVEEGKINLNEFYNNRDLLKILKVDSSKKNTRDFLARDYSTSKKKPYDTGFYGNVDVPFQEGPKTGTKEYNLESLLFNVKNSSKVKQTGKNLTTRTQVESELDPDFTNYKNRFVSRRNIILEESGKDLKNILASTDRAEALTPEIGHTVPLKYYQDYEFLRTPKNIKKFFNIKNFAFQDPRINTDILVADRAYTPGKGFAPELSGAEKVKKGGGFQAKGDGLLLELENFLNNRSGKKASAEDVKFIKDWNTKASDLYERQFKAVDNFVKDRMANEPYLKGQQFTTTGFKFNIKPGEKISGDNLVLDKRFFNEEKTFGGMNIIAKDKTKFNDLSPKEKARFHLNVINEYNNYIGNVARSTNIKGRPPAFNEEDILDIQESIKFGSDSSKGLLDYKGYMTPVVVGFKETSKEGLKNVAEEDRINDEIVRYADSQTIMSDARPMPVEEKGSLLGDIGAGAGLTTGAVLGSKATQADPLKGLRRFGKKGAMNLLKILGTPAGVAAYEAGLIPGLEGGVVDRLKEGDSAEDVFLRSPSTYAGLPLATLGQEFLKTRPALQRVLNLGLSPKLVRMGTPVGIGLMGLTALADSALKFQEEFDALSPEEKKAYLKEQEEFGEDIQGAAEGGRIGFADGPKDPSKRTFLKLMGGIASLPFVGKFFKAGKPVVEKLANTPTVMPDWFPNFVEKFMFNSVGKKIDADLMEYKNSDLPGVTVTRSDDGRVFVEGKNEYNETYQIEYEPPGYEVVDYETGKVAKTPGNFEAVEGRHVAMGPEDYDVEAFYADDLDEIAAGDIRAMEKYATGKVSGTVKDSMGKDTGLKKGEYDLNMAEGRAESAADIARDLDD